MNSLENYNAQHPEHGELHCSSYNFFISDSAKAVAIYNARTGALLRLDGNDGVELAKSLCGDYGYIDFNSEMFPADLLEQLISGGFLFLGEVDELLQIRKTYWDARGATPLVITITTTMDCNLGCYYCYESRTKEKIASTNIDSLVTSVRESLQMSKSSSLHIDWYGGEPLLNFDLLVGASFALQELCLQMGVAYRASIISNGTHWPDDIAGFISAHMIRQVQISFDGMEENHNKRRKYRREYRSDSVKSSFQLAVETVSQLVKCVRVDIRYNMDSKNTQDLIPFIKFSSSLGWYSALVPAVFQPARISAYSERANFLKTSQLTLEQFDSFRNLARLELNGVAKIEESEVPDGYPFPKTSVCAALAKHSQVIGADGLSYRCGLQVGEKHRAVGVVFHPVLIEPQLTFKDKNWWETFDPTLQPSCSKCSFLPICGGGCPKKHLEQDVGALKEQGEYWRNNLPTLIARKAGLEIPTSFAFTEKEQFRR